MARLAKVELEFVDEQVYDEEGGKEAAAAERPTTAPM